MSEQTELGASPYSARPAGLADRRAVAAIWAASQAADGPVFRPRRGWSLLQWATTIILLQQRGRSIGLAGLSSR
ncbi:MAG: hypothetical protein KGJ86_22655, partial [Chloroflexota bacterium]|nr:hypothetical protein [Chloroflexota bacterium]